MNKRNKNLDSGTSSWAGLRSGNQPTAREKHVSIVPAGEIDQWVLRWLGFILSLKHPYLPRPFFDLRLWSNLTPSQCAIIHIYHRVLLLLYQSRAYVLLYSPYVSLGASRRGCRIDISERIPLVHSSRGQQRAGIAIVEDRCGCVLKILECLEGSYKNHPRSDYRWPLQGLSSQCLPFPMSQQTLHPVPQHLAFPWLLLHTYVNYQLSTGLSNVAMTWLKN